MKEKAITLICCVLCVAIFATVGLEPNSAGGAELEETPAPLLSITPTPEPMSSPEAATPPWTYEEVEMLAKTIWAEARGVPSTARQAAVAWCALNRLDVGTFGDTLAEVLSKPYQFAYDPASPVTDEFLALADDVLHRWYLEQNGVEDVGRTLPEDYLFFEGDGLENHFRKEYEKTGDTWDWSLPDPYGEEGGGERE
jgi:hypothetical protein